jgi:Polysaccharide biosynthesis/export protein/AMIN domain
MKIRIIVLLWMIVLFVLQVDSKAAISRATFLAKIDYLETGKTDELYLYINDSYEFSDSLARDPFRIVIDLKPVIKNVSSSFKVSSKYIKELHIAQLQGPPAYVTRVVVDLKNLTLETMDYSLVKNEGALLLKIEAKNKYPGQNPPKNIDHTENVSSSNNPNAVPKTKPAIKALEIVKPKIASEEAKADDGYIIGPEDLLEIRIFELPDLSNTVRVMSNGKLNFPPLGDVDVSGLSKSQAEKKISALLQKNFINDAHAIIFIKEFKSQKVDIIGAVRFLKCCRKPEDYLRIPETN